VTVVDDLATVDGGLGLIERARAGDMTAFEQLVAPLIEPASQLACVILRDWHEAEDAVQEGAFKAWRAVGRLREGTTDLRPWFLTIVANEARSRRRSRWWGVIRLADPESGAAAGPEDQVALSTDLERAMARLEETDRLILFLHFYLDLPVEEVGRVLGLTHQATRSRMYRATRSMRPALRHGEDW
jgi:RNA polymerase sigma-70 factor (ECF subfamily)